MSNFITFLTDFGLQDDFVGTCHGVMKRIAPDAEIIDITHGIEPQQVLQGALVLANTLPYMPSGVHLAVVDPGVGGDRRAVALHGGDGRLYVGPDNGLLGPAAGDRVELEVALERYYATAARTFGDAGPGDIILYEDAYGNIAIAISRGSAASMFAVRPGEELRIHLRI